jgi:PKHD-type hydroxylase
MIIKNKYWVFSSALSKQFCEKIINLGLEKIQLEKQKGIDTKAVTFGNMEKSSDKKISIEDNILQNLKNDNLNNYYIRDSEVTWFNDKWIYDEIIPYINTANANAGWKYNIDSFEAFQFTVYNSPGGFYGWHSDMESDHNAVVKRYIYGVTETPFKKDGSVPSGYTKNEDIIGKVRKLSLTINLTEPENYEGGNLKFDLGSHTKNEQFVECVEARNQGTIIVFPSYLYHCVTPVTKGTRYSLVLWCSGEPFK